jgi:glutamine synthetase
MAACLGAGLWGMEHELDPGDPISGDAGPGDSPFPTSLDAATTLLERSRAAKRIFGAEFVDHYVRTRRWEVREFQRAVTDWEARRYLEMV